MVNRPCLPYRYGRPMRHAVRRLNPVIVSVEIHVNFPIARSTSPRSGVRMPRLRGGVRVLIGWISIYDAGSAPASGLHRHRMIAYPAL